MWLKSHKKAVHEGEEDSCGDCYYETGWKEHLKMHNLGCLKLTTQKKFIQSKLIIEIYYDSYLFKLKFDLDFHLIDFMFCFKLRVFELGTEESI